MADVALEQNIFCFLESFHWQLAAINRGLNPKYKVDQF